MISSLKLPALLRFNPANCMGLLAYYNQKIILKSYSRRDISAMIIVFL
jgi:hypothetical protein